MIRFLKYIFKVFSLILVVILVNSIINYRASDNFSKKVVKNLMDFDSLAVYINLPERLIVKERIKKIYSKTIVIGSSRSMLIGRPIKFICDNFSVSGASLKDYIAVAKLVKSNKINFDTLLIEISPWLFNENQENERYKTFENQNIKFKEITSFRYLMDNLTIKKTSFVIKKSDQILYKDGAIRYNQKVINNIGNLKTINDYARNEVFQLEGYNEISEINLKPFLNLINEFKNKKILFLVYPYPPATYEKILSKYPNVYKADSIIRTVAEKNSNIQIVGSLNPKINDIKNKDFYDGMHLTPTGIKKIIKNNKYVY